MCSSDLGSETNRRLLGCGVQSLLHLQQEDPHDSKGRHHNPGRPRRELAFCRQVPAGSPLTTWTWGGGGELILRTFLQTPGTSSGARPFEGRGSAVPPALHPRTSRRRGGEAARRRARLVLISSVFPALTPPRGVPASPRAAAAAAAVALSSRPRPPPYGGGDDSGLSLGRGSSPRARLGEKR